MHAPHRHRRRLAQVQPDIAIRLARPDQPTNEILAILVQVQYVLASLALSLLYPSRLLNLFSRLTSCLVQSTLYRRRAPSADP